MEMESPFDGGRTRILAAKRGAGQQGGTESCVPNGKPGQEPEAACRALTVRPAVVAVYRHADGCPHGAGSKDCFLEGPGLPREWPYRLTPDLSGATTIDHRAAECQSDFSMAGAAAIAASRRGSLTKLTPAERRAGRPTSGGRAGSMPRRAPEFIATPTACQAPPTPARGVGLRNFPTAQPKLMGLIY